MKTNTREALIWSLLCLAIGLVSPSAILFCMDLLLGHMDPLTSMEGILRRQFAQGHNLLLIALFGLIPFALMSGACVLAARRMQSARLACVAVGGLVGILVLMIPCHIAVWYPLYGSGHTSSTAVIAFAFIPFHCLATMCIGLFAGWLVSLLPSFRHENKIA